MSQTAHFHVRFTLAFLIQKKLAVGTCQAETSNNTWSPASQLCQLGLVLELLQRNYVFYLGLLLLLAQFLFTDHHLCEL